MGEEKVERWIKPRVILDTNVFISAILFGGLPGKLVSLWQEGEITLLLSSEVLREYLRVLSYPKFRLTKKEIRSLIDVELMPFVEPIKVQKKLRVVGKDASDNKFLELAVDGKADVIVSSDIHLLEIAKYEGIEILSLAEFLKRLG